LTKAQKDRKTATLEDRYIATPVGGAVGDTTGLGVECWKREQIRKYAGRITGPADPPQVPKINGRWIRHDEYGRVLTRPLEEGIHRGQVSDDTLTQLPIAESIAELKVLNLDDCARRQIEFYQALAGQPFDGGYGRTTRVGFDNIIRGISIRKSGVFGGPGNGPPMKTGVIGLYMHATGQYMDGLQFAAEISRLTHLDPRSIAGGVAQAWAVYTLLSGVDRSEFVEQLIDITSPYDAHIPYQCSHKDKGNLTKKLEWVAAHADVEPQVAYTTLRNSSHVMQSYPFTIFMFTKYWDSPLEGLLETINWGGDTDTNGSIYGTLCGAKNGMIFPSDWLEGLEHKDRLIAAGRGIYTLRDHEGQ
jgi:ADP-ribosylglycohydrolase